jgi:SAM-dependent methyltransferase
MTDRPKEIWASGAAYESYVGRWSRPVASEFLVWLSITPGSRWLDVGCGTGALSGTIARITDPALLVGIDASTPYVTSARQSVADPRSRFAVADAESLPHPDGRFDAAVSGLVLNFLPRPEAAVAEMTRVLRSGGVAAAYVWDYADRMEFIRTFWDAALALDARAFALDEGRRFPLCRPEPLQRLFTEVGLQEVAVRSIDVPTRFKSFEDYWSPFEGGQGPAPGYAMSLTEDHRTALRDRLREMLPILPDGSIDLVARAWAVRGRCAS